MMLADSVRLLIDLVFYSVCLLPAGCAFVLLWQVGGFLPRVLAFPAAYVGLVVGFWIGLLLLRLVFIRKISPGTYDLQKPEALRWIIADTIMRLVERSFLHPYVDDFTPTRYVFYRLMGARVDTSFFFGWDAKILDPWLLEVGRGAVIGSFAVIAGHSVEGDKVVLDPVRIGDGATVGVRSVLLPGVEVGANAIVGAGSLVTKGTVIPEGEIWAGVPARKIGTVEESQPPGEESPEEKSEDV